MWTFPSSYSLFQVVLCGLHLFAKLLTTNVGIFQHSEHTALLLIFVNKYFGIHSLWDARHSLSTLRFLENSMIKSCPKSFNNSALINLSKNYRQLVFHTNISCFISYYCYKMLLFLLEIQPPFYKLLRHILIYLYLLCKPLLKMICLSLNVFQDHCQVC